MSTPQTTAHLPPELESKPQPFSLTLAEGTQWLTFALGSCLGAPLLVAGALRLDHAGASIFIQSALIFGALGAIWQLFYGHRLIIAMVPGLLWATVTLGLVRFGEPGDEPMLGLLTDVQGALIVTGLFLVILSITGVIGRVLPLLTPLTLSAYLLLLITQAVPPILQDAFAVGVYGPGLDTASTISSLGLILLFLVFSHPRRPPFSRTLALPFAIIGGFLIMRLAGVMFPSGPGMVDAAVASETTNSVARFIRIPFFPWGPPTFNIGAIMAILPNVLAVIAAATSAMTAGAQVFGGGMVERTKMQRSLLGIGLFTMAGATSSVIAPVHQAESAGFIEMTGMRRWRSFVLGMCFVVLVGISPLLTGYLTAIPKSLLAAALLASLCPMPGIAVRALKLGPQTNREYTIFGLAILFGTGAAALPAEVLLNFPLSVRYLLANGMTVGVLTALLMQHVIFPRPWTSEGANEQE